MARAKQVAIEETTSKIESVAAYIRVSSDEQALHGISLDAQEEKLRIYAEKNNMRIVEWYKDEGVSGRKPIKKRPELQRMIQDAERGLFTRIIFVKLDRFFRSVAEYWECMKRIEPVVWCTTEEKYDQATANGRFFINAKLAVAEMEADQTGERIKMVNDYKITTGQPLSGSVPFCYKISTDEKSGRKKLIKNPETANIMYDALDHFMRYQSLRQTVIYLNSKYEHKLYYKSLSNAFKNPLICGEYKGNISFCDDAYVDRETFDKIQVILSRNKKKNTQEREYIFSGLVKCQCCGRLMAGSTTGWQKRADGSFVKYKGYRCSGYRVDRVCSNSKMVYEKTLETLMLKNIEKFLEDAENELVRIQDANETSASKVSIDDINARIDRLNYSWQTGKIRTVEQYEKQYAELMAELEKLKKTQEEIVTKDFARIKSILKSGWREIYRELDDVHKQAFWRSFVESIEVDWAGKEKKIIKVNFF